jgi:hexulose-6-phosphate isomerase
LPRLAAVMPLRPVAAAQAQAAQKPASSTIHKSTLISMLPRGMTYADRFALAREAGFEAIEMQTITKDEEAAEIKEASKKTGLRIHSVMNSDHWRFPLSSDDPKVVADSVKYETSLKNAMLWGLIPCCSCRRWSMRKRRTRMRGHARSA